MSTETGKKSSDNRDAFQAEFDALPLEEKFNRLFKMEAATIGETLNYVARSGAKAFEKFGEVVNDFSSKVEAEVKKATSQTTGCAPKAEESGSKTKPRSAPRGNKRPRKDT